MNSTKQCSRCGEIKPLDKFYRDATRPDGRRGYCGDCGKDYSKNYHHTHREQRAAGVRQWHEDHRDEVAKRRRADYAANSDRERAQARGRYVANRARVFDHYGRSCRCCGATKNLSIDHVNGDGKEHRLSVGIGSSAAEMYRWLVANNCPAGFQTLCVPCNKSKGDRSSCILDHENGMAVGMTSAQRSRRWRERQIGGVT